MKATLFAAALLTIASTASLAQNVVHAEQPAHYSHSQLKALIRNARTSADYLALRDYYSHIAETDRNLAAEEKQEWNRRAANPVAYARKYPSPVDSAHYLYDSYSQSANTAESEARRYELLAKTARDTN
jgi:hypothetical protein